MGLVDANDEPNQINDHVLQIENEYYSLVRPKQVPKAGETPSQALANRGIGYVELRAVDVNPYSAIGIDEDTAGFLEVLALYCLLSDSPELWEAEQDLIDRNQNEVVNRGRAPNAKILELDAEYPLLEWIEKHVTAMLPLAEVLNQSYSTDLYRKAMSVMQTRVDDVDETLSAQVIADTMEHGGTWSFGGYMADQHIESYQQHVLSAETLAYFEQLTETSLAEQQQLEQDTSVCFDDYLSKFR